MKDSEPAWSFNKTKKQELERNDRRYTPGPGQYSISNVNKDKAPTWR